MGIPPFLKHFSVNLKVLILIAGGLLIVCVFGVAYYEFNNLNQNFNSERTSIQAQLADSQKKLNDIQSQDPYKTNKDLMAEIKSIHDLYSQSITSYQNMIDLEDQKVDIKTLRTDYASLVNQLATQNYSSGSATLADLNKQIDDQNQKLAAKIAPPPPAAPSGAPVAVNNSPPGSGFSQQSVQTDSGTFTIDIIAADLNSTKVIVDTASDSDCGNSCPVMPLASYATRNGAYAGMNGSFFCPESYPSCAGKTNSFDTLLMNKNKHYFNSDNNVYSTIPAVIFSSGSIRFVGQSLDWGRDTGIDSMIANYPMLVQGGNFAYPGSGDPKFNAKGARNFVANKGNMVYIGSIFNATMEEAGHVLKTLGMDNALNMDEGGSTALWSGGYKVGPGRDIPNAILFVKK